ncbi:MAG: tyrosine-type recombinase/integrase [Flavobacteriaceae bacterium]|nr:tyrosine-type recombinase/integrase [Flavobacteriaceae bacterium]
MSQFSDYLNYLSLEKKCSPHTVLAYTKDLESFAAFCSNEFDSEEIKDCVYPQIRNWIVELLEEKVSNRTVNRKIASLKSYYKFLLKVELIKVSPLVKHKALKVSKKIQIPFSVNEMEKVLEDVWFEDSYEGERDKFMIELFYATGIRKAELIGLTLKDVDLAVKTIKVLGKRNKERIIPLTTVLIDSLKRYLKVREGLLVEIEIDSLFLTKKGAKIYDSLVYRVINLYFSRASSKVKKSPHVLRHTFATHLLNEGADLNAVKELLGHTSLAATQIYVHSSMAKLKEVYRKSHPRNVKT